MNTAVIRMLDIAFAGLGLLISLPILLLIALLGLCDTGSPVFAQQRVGRYQRPFTLYKFRTMSVGTASVATHEVGSSSITPMGAVLRKTKIDELPQLINVLKGEMSFVGPRPEVPAFVSDLERELPYYAERHVVKPGITGWAQINYPYGASIEDARHKLEYDLYYAKNYTPFLDLLILLQTARVILWPDGAR